MADRDVTAVAVPLIDLEGWEGWPYSQAQHVAGAYDIALFENGFHALFPWCTLVVEKLIAKRHTAGDDLATGEAATLAISVLRGMAELGDGVGRVRGEWWLTHDSRPVFVVGRGLEAAVASAQLFGQLAQTSSDRCFARVVAQMRDAAAQPRTMVRDIERWESEILECAATQPLRTEVIDRSPYAGAASAIVSEVAHARSSAAEAVRALRMPQPENPVSSVEKASPVKDALRELARRVAPFTEPLKKLVGGEGRSRNRRVAVAASAAGLVLLLGVLWPTNSDAQADEFVPIPIAGESPESTKESQVPEDPMSAFVRVIAQARQCVVTGDEECSGAIAGDSDVPATELVRIADMHVETSLADDFGDVAVIRLESIDTEHVVVLMRTNERWLVRDVYQLRGN